MLLSIIIPVFNEHSSVVEVVDRVLSMELPPGLDREVILVDDGSTDGTRERLQKFDNHPIVRVHQSVLNFGKGVAVRIGFRYVRGDIVAIQDADLEYDPTHLKPLAEAILSGQTQVVFGSRYLGRRTGMVALQDLGNRILTAFVNLLYGSHLTDAYTCYKVMTREVADSLLFDGSGLRAGSGADGAYPGTGSASNRIAGRIRRAFPSDGQENPRARRLQRPGLPALLPLEPATSACFGRPTAPATFLKQDSRSLQFGDFGLTVAGLR